MQKLISILFLVLITMLTTAGAEEIKNEGDETVELLFVQDAEGVRFDKGTMTLKKVKPMMLYFSDRPHRIAGHMTIEKVLEEVEETFSKTPPNATLVILEGEKMVDVVMVLPKRPTLKGKNLIFEGIQILEGELPAKGGACALFIDTVGRPLRASHRISTHRRGNPRGPRDPRGALDPRGAGDPRGRYDPRGPHDPR